MSNQLGSVSDGRTGSFVYDMNGNVTTDGTRGVTLNYNQLNLPATVSGVQNAAYTYDAGGTKLKSVQGPLTREYISGIQYSNNVLDFVSTDEGRAVRNPGNGVHRYEYNLRDQLGNVRVSIDDNGGTARVIQEDEFYAFGLNRSLYTFSDKNNYFYNGKEKQDVLTDEYGYGARFYDPVIGRWTTVDPSAEREGQESLTPYQYGLNNPIRYDDPDGRCPTCLIALGGALIGGGIELGGQLLSGKSFREVDWADVGVEALKGGLIGSGVGAAYVTAAEVGGVAVKASFDLTAGEGGNKNVFNGQKSVGNALFDAGTDLVAGKIAGAVGEKITGGLENSIKTETKAAKSLVKAENAFNKVTDGGKDMFGAKSMIAAEKLGVAQSTSQAARKAVVRSQMATATSKSAVSSAVKNGAQNTVVDKVKNFFGL